MRKGNGGYIGPLNNPTTTVASGIWSMDEQQQYLGARQWPGTPAATSPAQPTISFVSFTASISSSTMTVSAISSGTLAVGQLISGTGVSQYTIITAQLTGSAGSTGTYTVSIAQTVSSTTMSATLSILSTTSTTSSIQIPFGIPFDGGSAITGYTARVYAGSSLIGTATGASSPLTVTSIPNNVIYSVNVYATNSVGNSPAQNSWPYIKTPSAPDAPTIGTATLVGSNVSVAFTAPTTNNGSTITSYTATSSPGGFTGTASSSPITVSGLAATTAYTFTVTATNIVGTGPASAASNSVTTPAVTTITYLAVAGGGAGGPYLGGGGGGGGYVANSVSFAPGVVITVSPGPGGSAIQNTSAINGTSSTITATGLSVIALPGAGGTYNRAVNGTSGVTGSGDGASAYNTTSGYTGAGGLGTSGQGFNGGSIINATNNYIAAGGGGAGGVGLSPVLGSGSSYSTGTSGGGGVGITTTLITTAQATSAGVGQVFSGSIYFGGGGAGGAMNSYYDNTAFSGTGGLGGGAGPNPTRWDGTVATTIGANGTAYTGGGATGANTNATSTTGGSGGSGVVILSIPTTNYSGTYTGSPVIFTNGSNKVLVFKGAGTYTV
jgi:hypothetical protein